MVRRIYIYIYIYIYCANVFSSSEFASDRQDVPSLNAEKHKSKIKTMTLEEMEPASCTMNYSDTEVLPEDIVTLTSDLEAVPAMSNTRCGQQTDLGDLSQQESVQSVADDGFPMSSATVPPSMRTNIETATTSETQRCNKCEEPLQECKCEEIPCATCLRSADVCDCIEPSLKIPRCPSCNLDALSPSLHDNSFLMTPGGFENKCRNCSSTEFVAGKWSWLTPSDHRCELCFRRDSQRTMQQCDGAGCPQQGLFHPQFLTAVSASSSSSHGRSVCYLCPHCVQQGEPPWQSSVGSDDGGENADGDEHLSCEAGYPELDQDEMHAFKEWFP